MNRPRRTAATRLAVLAVVASVAPATAHAATLIVDNADPAGQGLNDPTPFVPIGGNTATTLGAARLAVFNQAAATWGANLTSAVPIHVNAQMTALACSATSAELAVTSAGSVHRDFPSAPVAATWYPQALANALAGTDLDPSTPDIETQFNGAIGTSACSAPISFYLGLDAHPGSNQIDLLTVVIHELAHGLGFISLVDFSTGAKLSGLDDAFELNMQQLGASPAAVSAMTNAQRVSAAISDPDLYWAGGAVQGDAGTLTAGLISGHVRLYAPATFAAGMSVSHYSTALTPNQLMEPFYTGPTRDLKLTVDLLRDVGWSHVAATTTASVPALPAASRGLLVLALALAAASGLGRLRSRRPAARSSGGLGRRRV